MKRVKPDSDRIEVLTEAEKIVLVDFVREEFCLCDDTSAAYKSHHDRNPAYEHGEPLKNIANCDDGLALEFKMKVDQLQLEPTQKVIRFKCARGSQD
ncbi:unnamed protein product [Heligmosomoides polygyrus]|uniref:Transposase n=1 Tax=Heligmosomoides polygyrus TaxID=6339 RepID=A0A183F699_HELPZ|nr:unnamed protein product [Heligmosomoides polygyrus]